MLNRPSTTRWVLTVVVALAALLLLGFGAVASWTASTTNPGNSFAAGTLHILDSQGSGCTDISAQTPPTCTAILTATGMKPGGPPVTGTVTITNTGTLAGTYSLQALNETGSATLCSHLDLTVTDDATPTANTIYSGTVGGMAGAGSIALTPDNPFAASTGAHTFTFSVQLDATTSTTADEGLTCSVDFQWTAVPA